MTIQLNQNSSPANENALQDCTHILIVLPPEEPADMPFAGALKARMQRSRGKYADLQKDALSLDLPNGALSSWLVVDAAHAPFRRYTALRKAIRPLLDEKPEHLAIAVFGDESFRQTVARDAALVALLNGQELPSRKAKRSGKETMTSVSLFGAQLEDAAALQALVAGNTLCRTLTMLPPNELTPRVYRDRISDLAKRYGWELEEYDMERLRAMGAGAFVAVGQGSEPQDAAIVHLRYRPDSAQKHVALVGKGICFDTGGHNLKPARYMQGMHEDMNGSAVVLGILLAATESRLPVNIDCWLAIAQNHISPAAYKQNDIVTALNGTTIEVVHTDAEGRMVLADTLTLASRAKPGFIMDFATLTGSMVGAVGTRYSGVLGNSRDWLQKAVEAGQASGERVCAFPFDEDYDEELESAVADVKQCTLDSEADHILAARFLSRFIEGDQPWLHVDLSTVNRKGGLGAVDTDVSGFGVGFGLEMLRAFMRE
ncbi:MAG TPA: leucyl aminopeptidase family protein [Methylophilaceae bacterium]